MFPMEFDYRIPGAFGPYHFQILSRVCPRVIHTLV